MHLRPACGRAGGRGDVGLGGSIYIIYYIIYIIYLRELADFGRAGRAGGRGRAWGLECAVWPRRVLRLR
jgi:hypothetical protein